MLSFLGDLRATMWGKRRDTFHVFSDVELSRAAFGDATKPSERVGSFTSALDETL